MKDVSHLPPGMVAAIASSNTGRYATFFENLNQLTLPPGTVMSFATGERRETMNKAVERMLETESYWLWFITDANGFLPDIVISLLDRKEPMIGPVSVEMREPFLPLAWTNVTPAGIEPFKLNQVVGPSSVFEVRGANVNAMLIRRAVFEAIDPPWFRTIDPHSEDVYFCERARDAGFRVMIDTTSRISTLGIASVIPTHNGHSWNLGVSVGDDIEFSMPLKHR